MSRTLTDEDINALADAVTARIVGVSRPVALPFRLNIRQFAVCIGRSEEVARRELRADTHGVVSKRLATGNPWQIHPSALPLFGVDLAMARQRLAAAGLLPPEAESAAKPTKRPQLSPV